MVNFFILLKPKNVNTHLRKEKIMSVMILDAGNSITKAKTANKEVVATLEGALTETFVESISKSVKRGIKIE